MDAKGIRRSKCLRVLLWSAVMAIAIILILLAVFWGVHRAKFAPINLFVYDLERMEDVVQISKLSATKRKDGAFYILEEPISLNWSDGSMALEITVYNGESINFYGKVKTNDLRSFQEMEADADGPIYFKIKGLPGVKLDFWGYHIIELDEQANEGSYWFAMGAFTEYDWGRIPFRVQFDGQDIPIRLKKVYGRPIRAEEATAAFS